MPPRLTTSSYAVLGLLALRPWSGYDLAQQAKRSLRFAWPKSESHLYAEPKKLVALGLATARTEPVGRRTRQVYEITPAGRAAFRAWLTTPPAPPALEAEALLRLIFADQGDRRELLATIETLEKQTQALYDEGMQILAGYAEGTTPFPDRLHLSVLFAAFQSDLYRLILDWARFAGREVRSWERTDGIGRTERVQEILETLLAGRSALDIRRDLPGGVPDTAPTAR